ncbi:unnamed protein product [Hymenolepis diminuta]|uniref:DUF5727 domain-containing protein n=1 Tax=Hymenolepis diminuta TaxID=6216 RepID=A0A564Z9L0_HYMDI|nr:unnamed protein product [Hymenolepis diminuta]
MIQLTLIFMCYFSSTFAENGEVLGSRIITNSSGKVGPMYFKSADGFWMHLHKTRSTRPKVLDIQNGNCIVDGKIVGSPCAVQEDRTVITFNEVTNYEVLVLENSIRFYIVYFAKDCKFPTPKDGEIIVEKSIPLYRFLGGKTEENVVFAMKGTDRNGIFLRREDSIICEWKDSNSETDECPNLIVDEVNGLIIFNATFSKANDKDYETLIWGKYFRSISVNLDWTNTGEAPEVKACGKSDD